MPGSATRLARSFALAALAAPLLVGLAACGSGTAASDDAGANLGDLAMAPAPDLLPPGPDLAQCLGTAASCGAAGQCMACPDGTNAVGTCAAGVCGLACNQGTTLCVGSCIDTSLNSHNCGGCNHDCLGGECFSSACQPAVLTETLNCEGVAVDDSNVYFTDLTDGSVYRRLLGGGNGLVQVAANQGKPMAVAVRAATVYWVDAKGGFVRSSPVQNPQVTDLATGQARPNDVAVDDTDVYWVNADDGTVNRVPQAGGQATAVATGQSTPIRLALDATNVYWSNQGDGTVRQVAKAGGKPVTVASGQASPYGVAVDGTSVYWVNDGDGTVNKAPIGGGQVTVLAMQQSHPHSIAVDATGVYWTNFADGKMGTVARVPSGKAPEVIATPPPITAPAGIALDAASVIFVDNASGIVWRLAK